ncbi:MAG TPA: hypothetical protein VF301_10660, partial [Ginsengibacter sp.]
MFSAISWQEYLISIVIFLILYYGYIWVGRIKTIIKNIDNLGDKTIATNTYNELGQLKSKVLGSGTDSMAYAASAGIVDQTSPVFAEHRRP